MAAAAKVKPLTRQQMIARDKIALRQQARGGGSYSSGLKVSLQKLEEEYVPSVKNWTARVDLYQRMGNDAKIAAVLRANILPLLHADKWRVEGGTDEARELVEANLMRRGDPALWCETSWVQRLFESLLCLQFGVSVFGKTREIVGDRMIFRRLTYLHPRSLGGPIGAWEWNADGTDLVAVHRSYSLPDGTRVTDERIPVEDVFPVVWWMAGENWEGVPIVRPMYRAFTEKDLAAKIQMIDLQNRGVGIPKAKLAPGDGSKQADTLFAMAKDLRGGSKERQAILLADGQELGFLTSEGNVVEASPIIEGRNNEIAAGSGTDFQQQGQTQSGSRATGSVLMVNYMQELDATREWIQDQWNHGSGYLRGPVEELCDENFGPQEEYPQIVGLPVSPTTQIDNVSSILDGIQKGGLTHDLHVENHLRKSLGVKPISPAEFQKIKDAAKPIPSIGGRPDSPTPSDRDEPRDDDNGRAFGLAEKKTANGGTRPPSSVRSWGWLKEATPMSSTPA